MCGISGFVSFRGSSSGTADADRDVLKRMTDRLSHRGPDADGFWSAANVHFGHRRLAVIDIAASLQPMHTADGRFHLVYNGELYNFRELRTELEALGTVFRTRGDTEVVLQAIAHWGNDALKQFRGMFAFACLDSQTGKMLVARDHLGVKPLYLVHQSNLFAFASELKSICAHPDVAREIDLESLRLFLECQYIPAPNTIYKSVRKLEAGWAMEIDTRTGESRRWQYWKPTYVHKTNLSDAAHIDALDVALRASVSSMLVADVPLGAFVSGGVDSSVVAALMTDITARPIETFNLGFIDDDGRANQSQSEHDVAAEVGRHLGSHHHALMVRSFDVMDAFGEWVDVFDEPFGDQAALPTMLLSKLTRQHVTVALTGEGADELFSGYANYRKRARDEQLTQFLGGSYSPLPMLFRALPRAARKDRFIKAVVTSRSRRYATIPNVFDRSLHAGLLSPAFMAQPSREIADYAAAFYDECDAADYIERLMYVDMRLWLPDDLLTKVDRATMAYSLEARVPYLDHAFVEHVATLPAYCKQRGKTTKWILKQLAERYLPSHIVNRNKQGFVMPLSEWLGGRLKPHVDNALSDTGLGKRGLFRTGALTDLLAEHQRGTRNHAGRIWALTVLEEWFKRYEPDFNLDSAVLRAR